jgi:hypothetical protein
MQSSYLVLDDFFDRPDKARESALGMDYPPAPDTVYYQGRNSRQSMAWPGHEKMFSNILGQQLVPLGQSHGCARITLGDDERTGRAALIFSAIALPARIARRSTMKKPSAFMARRRRVRR